MHRLRFALVTLAVALVGLSACEPADQGPRAQQDWTLRAEASDYRETASYDEVIALLEQAARTRPDLHLTYFGYSNEGRPLPLLVAGPVTDAEPASIWDTGLPVVYLQANIHAGEVAGKEALLRLVRELALGERASLLRELVLLIGPTYNADGTERVDLRNRPRQYGPLGGMGTRTNAQGLDLNRDQMKLDSPEARSLAHLFNRFDPHVFVDLHTTNGTQHAYHLTYSPPLHPATPSAIDDLLREDLLPRVTHEVEARYGWHFWHYGNAFERDGVQGWYTFDHRPRFVTNYAGLRNRIGILSEAYSYATFEDRILASELFVEGILRWVRDHPERVMALAEEEDARELPGSRIPVRGGFPEEAPIHPILMGAVEEEAHPWTGETILRRTDEVRERAMPAFVAFMGTEDEVVPAAYLIPRQIAPVVERLRAHGVRLEPADDPDAGGVVTAALTEGEWQRFMVQDLVVAEQTFQGRNEVTLQGAWEGASQAQIPTEEALSQWLLLPMDQPLARLAFLLLEPRADDGFVNWGIMDDWLDSGAPFPILRVLP